MIVNKGSFLQVIKRGIGCGIIVFAVSVTATRWALPVLSKDNVSVKQYILGKVPFPLVIQSLDMSLSGTKLKIRLKDVDIYNERKFALHAEELDLVVDIFRSIFYQSLNFKKIIIKIN